MDDKYTHVQEKQRDERQSRDHIRRSQTYTRAVLGMGVFAVLIVVLIVGMGPPSPIIICRMHGE